jgi:nitroimidazol reductase NimA-like FMN-containing flavoprotein (pyridoxamine 5'-phosphate oxidase superfamily)
MKELSEGLREFVEKQELLRLAYVDGAGYPRAVPLWYVVIDGDCYCGTGSASAKWKLISEDPRVGWVIDGGQKPGYKGASMYGRAEEVTDLDKRAEVYYALGNKYFGSADDPKFVEIYGEVDDDQTVYFRLRAEDGIAWEY